MTAFYQKIRSSGFVQTVLAPCNSVWFAAVPFLLALLSNMFSLELSVYVLVVIISGFIILFNHDTKPVIPFFVAMYFGTARKNSPILTDKGIYQTVWSMSLIIGLVVIAVICFAARVILTGEYKRFRFKNMRMSAGLLAFGAALMLGGIFSSEASFNNFLFGCVQFVAFSFIYLYFTVTVDWNKTDIRYLSYAMMFMSLLMCFELMWIYITVDGIVTDGIINKGIILTGWGIQNNIGGMMVLGLPFCFYLAAKERSGWIFILLSGFIFCFSFFTLSRNSILTGGGIMVVGSVLACIFAKNRLTLFIILVAVAAAGISIALIFRDSISGLFESMAEIGLDLNGREELFIYGLKEYLSNPAFGVGWFMDPGFEVYDMFVPGRYHNMFIQILASCGTVGMLAYLFHLQQAARVLLKKLTAGRLFIGFGILTLMALSQMDNHFFNIGPGLIYSVLLCFLEGDLKSALGETGYDAAGFAVRAQVINPNK